jgi:hypothetical protein
VTSTKKILKHLEKSLLSHDEKGAALAAAQAILAAQSEKI